jgi:hypothetical protein
VKGTPQGRKVLISALLGLGRANPDTCPFRSYGLSSTVKLRKPAEEHADITAGRVGSETAVGGYSRYRSIVRTEHSRECLE